MKKLGLAFFPLVVIVCFYFWTAQEKKSIIDNRYYMSAPIEFMSSGLPYLTVEIEGKKFPAELDLGYYSHVALTNNLLTKIAGKTFIGTASSCGWDGKKYASNVFEIPEIKINKISIHPLYLYEEDPEFLTTSRIITNETEALSLEHGRLGWRLFKKTKLFLDLGNAKIAVCDSIETFQKQGYDLATFSKTPILLDNGLLEIDADTANGPLRCLLDTGCTVNILNTPLPSEKSMEEMLQNRENFSEIKSFHIGGKNLGTAVFRCLSVQLPFKIEAILGMEFFLNHQVLIDFANGEVYFARRENG
ncbi:MAG TPA: hypothetical protein VLF94_03670 [Chlamydiales bacterium]|nr:hypothetical protein [Chlamydiales bacterium]